MQVYGVGKNGGFFGINNEYSDKEIIEMESKYKNRYLTREYGLNDN